MGVMIKGIRLDSISISKDDKTGHYKLTGHYELMSQTDVVLAKNSFNDSWGDSVKVEGAAVSDAINKLVVTVKDTLEATLGFTKE